jgi:methylphosphotriester-DNA--protein-cysteine methyltransferase
MSVSAFHRNFQAVTPMTDPVPEAHTATGGQAAAGEPSARHHRRQPRVGYDNLSQFSREYRRQFGVPPSIDAVRMRDRAGATLAVLP